MASRWASASIVVVDEGMANHDDEDAKDDIYAFVFGQKA
jgi:hypothetical protein